VHPISIAWAADDEDVATTEKTIDECRCAEVLAEAVTQASYGMLLATMVDRCSLHLGSSLFRMRPDCRGGLRRRRRGQGEGDVALGGARNPYEKDDEARARGHAFPLSETIILKSPKESLLEGSACGACELRSNSSERQRASNPQAGHAFCTTSARAHLGARRGFATGTTCSRLMSRGEWSGHPADPIIRVAVAAAEARRVRDRDRPHLGRGSRRHAGEALSTGTPLRLF